MLKRFIVVIVVLTLMTGGVVGAESWPDGTSPEFNVVGSLIEVGSEDWTDNVTMLVGETHTFSLYFQNLQVEQAAEGSVTFEVLGVEGVNNVNLELQDPGVYETYWIALELGTDFKTTKELNVSLDAGGLVTWELRITGNVVGTYRLAVWIE